MNAILGKLRRKLRTFRSLPWSERWLIFQAWFLLLFVDLGLRLLPFRRLQTLLLAASPAAEPANSEALIQRASAAVERAARNHLYPMTCLRRALTLGWLLARQGIATELRFGARTSEGKLEAHAWLEHAGKPIGEPRPVEERFSTLLSSNASSVT